MTVTFEDDLERIIHVDDVVAVEMPYDPELQGGNVLVDYDDTQVWAFLNKSEVWKVEKYKAEAIERNAGIRVAARALRRSDGLVEWLRKNNDSEPPLLILPALIRNWERATQ